MNGKNIKDSITKTITIIFISMLFLFAFTWIIFDFQGSSNSLKDTWAIVSSLFGGIATLAAAYIASLLFNDWKDEYNHRLESSILMEYINKLDIIDEAANHLQATLTFSSESEMDSLDDQVKDVHPYVLTSEIKKQKDDFNSHNFNSWTVSNKYQLLNDLNYTESLISMIAFMNEAFESAENIESLIDKDNQINSIKAEKVQSYINWALEEVNHCISILESTYSNAIKDIKAYK
ncbi:hypothetical protein [Acinetobacter sp. YH16057]|uniref:hypothetical protein n=1 Tax=Acinetobacter sp. YH16057 TaxID=2601195 RepID=UPI0015D1A495|nr:hypothetical protein [Acinetobacter sp. YH16057]